MIFLSTGVAPFLTVRIGPHHTIFSDFEKLVLFLDAQVGDDNNYDDNCYQ